MPAPREDIHVAGRAVDVRLWRVGPRAGPPVLLVPGLAAAPLEFCLQPRRPLSRVLSESGRTPWVVDFQVLWRRGGQDAASLLHGLELALVELERHGGHGLDEVDGVGHSLGGLLLLALALDGAPFRRLVTLGSALDFRLGATSFDRSVPLARRLGGPRARRLLAHGLPVRRLSAVASTRAGLPGSSLLLRDQFHPGATAHATQRAMLRYGVRDVSLPLLLDLAELFGEQGLRLGRNQRPLRASVPRLQQPLLMVGSVHDRQCPIAAVRHAAEAIPSARLHEIGGSGRRGAGLGHLDLLVGRHAPDLVFEPLVRFLDASEVD